MDDEERDAMNHSAELMRAMSEAMTDSPEDAGALLMLAFGRLCDDHDLDPELLLMLAKSVDESAVWAFSKPTAEA